MGGGGGATLHNDQGYIFYKTSPIVRVLLFDDTMNPSQDLMIWCLFSSPS